MIKRNGRSLILLIFVLLTSGSPQAHAYFQQELMNAKVGERREAQWNIVDWLDQKRRIGLLDSWLAMNRSVNWLDVTLSGAYSRYRWQQEASGSDATETFDSQIYSADIFVSIFNLYAEYEPLENDLKSSAGALGVRLFGTSTQDTSMVLRYGLRKLVAKDADETWDSQFAEGVLQLYVLSFFGLEAKYRHYFPAKSNLENEIEGHRLGAGGFIEAGIFRLFGNLYKEKVSKTDERQGAEAGVKFLF